MLEHSPMIFIHGLEGTSQGVKASLLRSIFPRILIPDFRGSLDERMAALEALLGDAGGWTMIGSSFGGLMAAMFANQHPHQVKKLILLAPALIWPDLANSPPEPIDVPTVIYHGAQDELLPVHLVRQVAEKVFLNLDFHVVEDDHGLYKTVHSINWPSLVASP